MRQRIPLFAFIFIAACSEVDPLFKSVEPNTPMPAESIDDARVPSDATITRAGDFAWVTVDCLRADCGQFTGTLAGEPERPNQPPVPHPGPGQSIHDNNNDGWEIAALDGSRSYDPDGTIVAWEWTHLKPDVQGTILRIPLGSDPVVTTRLYRGTNTVELTVTDDDGASASAIQNIDILEPIENEWQPPLGCIHRAASQNTAGDLITLHAVTITTTIAWYRAGPGYYERSTEPILAFALTLEKNFLTCTRLYRERWTRTPSSDAVTLETRAGWHRQRYAVEPTEWCWEYSVAHRSRVLNTPFTDAIDMNVSDIVPGECLYLCDGNDPNVCSASVAVQ